MGIKKIGQCLFILCCTQAFAELTCHDLEGLWWGTMTDESHLMLDDPIVVLFKIKKNQDQYIGQFEMMPENSSISSRVWFANCKEGELNNMYFIDPKNNFCGIASKDVSLAENLEMVLNWQNAMVDTKLKVSLVPLKDKDINKFGFSLKNRPMTCH